jgi:hypothetical protein
VLGIFSSSTYLQEQKEKKKGKREEKAPSRKLFQQE